LVINKKIIDMKKQILLGSFLLTAISAFSQNEQIKPKPTGLINSKIIAASKFDDTGIIPQVISAIPNADNTNRPQANSASKTTSANTWNNFTSSMNIYGSVIGYCKPLQWNDELNAVTFVHRKSPTYPTTGSSSLTESGSIVAMISLDCGASWDSTLVYADVTNRGRYPQGAIYNPPSNTNINNAYIVADGPVTLGSGWVGNFYASKQLGSANYNSIISAVPNAVQYFASAGPYTPNLGKHDFSAYSFTSTDDGKVRSLATIASDINNTTAGRDTAVMLVTGTFNNGVFDWAGTAIYPPTTVNSSDGERQWVARPMMAWNESGTIGYIVTIGSRVGATGSNVGFQPIVFKTINGGASWSLEPGIDFNNSAFKDVKRPIVSVATDSTLQVPFFNWIEGMDCTVDANNKLHIFSTIIGTASNHPDSTGFITSFGTEGYRWPHKPGYQPYLYDFIYDGTSTSPGWSHITVDSMSSEGPSDLTTGKGYNDNPWDSDPTMSNAKVRIDSRLQMSRTPDGKYLVYSWAESDTTFTNLGKKWNNIPDIKARVMDVTTGLTNTVEINVTRNDIGQISGHAMYHFISPKCKLMSDGGNPVGPVLNIPMTISNSSPYRQASTNKHWYSCTTLDFRYLTVGIAENNLNSTNNSFIYPNPAKNNATLNINLATNSKIQVEILNTIGQVVKTTKAEGQSGTNSVNIDLGGLSSGIYLVNVKVDNAASTRKLIVE
jgi:hypothetical protein